MKKAARELIVASGFVAATQAIAHWFPWNRALGDELGPPYSYIVGTVQILIAFIAWAFRQQSITSEDAVCGLCAIAGASGASVCGCYAIDWIINRVFSLSVGRTDGRSVQHSD